MTDARDTILNAVRGNHPAGDHPLPDLPVFPMDDGGDRVALFLKRLQIMGGHHIEGPTQTIGQAIALLQEQGRIPDLPVIASAVKDYSGAIDLDTVVHPRDLAGVDIAIVRAAFGIAETGSVLLTDALLHENAVAYLAQHLIILLDPADIVPGLQDAYFRPDMSAHAYASFHTGPSATADIEGVLIHGAQGVRSLCVVLVPRTG